MTQGIQEQIGILPAIEAEGHFVQVGREMLGADPMPGSDDATLQEGESILNGIGMHFTLNINLGFVLDSLMLSLRYSCFGDCVGVNRMFIGNQNVYVLTDVFSNVLRNCTLLNISCMEETKIAITLPDADDDLLCVVSESRFALASMQFAADIGFIHFDSTIEHGLICFFHCCTDAMAKIPSSLIAHPNGTLDLVSGDSLARFAEQQCHHEPFRQRKMRVMEDRAGSDRELVIALSAVEQLVAGNKPDNFLSVAAWAFGTVGPAQTLKQFTALLIGREHLSNFREGHCAYPV